MSGSAKKRLDGGRRPPQHITLAGKQASKQTGRQADRQAGRQAGRQTGEGWAPSEACATASEIDKAPLAQARVGTLRRPVPQMASKPTYPKKELPEVRMPRLWTDEPGLFGWRDETGEQGSGPVSKGAQRREHGEGKAQLVEAEGPNSEDGDGMRIQVLEEDLEAAIKSGDLQAEETARASLFDELQEQTEEERQKQATSGLKAAGAKKRRTGRRRA